MAQQLTPTQLAEKVNRDPKVVRAYLRRNFTRPGEAKGSRWTLDKTVEKATVAHFAALDEKASAKAS